jgi:hypothetical protein
VAALLFLATTIASAQTVRDGLESLRGALKADRKAMIAEQMMLTPGESEAFWPIYRSYRAEAEKVTDSIVKIVLEYSDGYPSMPEEKARQLLKDYSRAEANLLSVRRKYVKKFGKVLPAAKVFRFVQLDNRYDLGIRVGLAEAVPILPQQPAAASAAPH